MFFFLICGVLLSGESGWCQSCVQVKDYVCNQIPAGYPPGVSSLVIFVNNMGLINMTVFNDTNLSSVNNLTLAQSGVTDIVPGAFSQFQHLKMLNLHNNNLSFVTSAWFTHKKVLENLILSNNSISELNDNSFNGLVGLSILKLSQNQINSVSIDTFHSLVNLRHLDLSNNKLSHLNVETLISLNNSKVLLNGNPWDCSCSMYEFGIYLRGLQKASLLLNEKEVLCESPAHRKGIPVWKVSRCLSPTTRIPTTSQTIRPGINNQFTLIGLIGLYHRKRKRNIQTIQPATDVPEFAKSARPDNRAQLESVSDQKTKHRNEQDLAKLDKRDEESKKVSHIYQIYSTRPNVIKNTGVRAKSAGPVLSRTDGFCWHSETAVKNQQDPGKSAVTDQRSPAGLKDKGLKQHVHEKPSSDMIELNKEQEMCGEAEQLAEKREVQKQPSHLWREPEDRDLNTNFELEVKCEQKNNLDSGDKNGTTLEKMLKDSEFMTDENDVENYLTSSHEAIQPLEDGENIPYFTVGADPKNQSSNPEQIHETKIYTGRPIARVLTWPPTAAQWKKQWSQNQQVLNISPNLIFVTQYMHQVTMFPSGVTSARPENIQQGSGSSALPDYHQSIDFSGITPAGMSNDNKSCNQDSSENCVNSKKQSDLNASNLSLNTHLKLFCNSPLCEAMISATDERTEKPVDPVKEQASQTLKTTPNGSESAKRSSKSKSRGRKSEMEKQRPQARSESSSGVPVSGGSPSDDNLLVDNEYTFIDLLHEVVENQGRWTRDHWRQSHMSKQKCKHHAK